VTAGGRTADRRLGHAGGGLTSLCRPAITHFCCNGEHAGQRGGCGLAFRRIFALGRATGRAALPSTPCLPYISMAEERRHAACGAAGRRAGLAHRRNGPLPHLHRICAYLAVSCMLLPPPLPSAISAVPLFVCWEGTRGGRCGRKDILSCVLVARKVGDKTFSLRNKQFLKDRPVKTLNTSGRHCARRAV
jgi:hypothetical protein